MSTRPAEGADAPLPRSPKPVYFLCFGLVGVSMAMAGPALTHLRDQVGASVAAGGVILGSLAVGYIVASLGIGRLLDRGAGHRTIISAGIVIVASTLALQAPTSLWPMVAIFTVLGAAGGVIDVACNTLLVWDEPPGRAGSALNALHLCFGIGAIASPLLVAASLRVSDSLMVVAAAMAAMVATVAWGFRTRPAATPRVHVAPTTTAGGAAGRGPGNRTRVLAAAAAFFAFYVAAEGTFASWAATYGESLDLRLASGPALLTAVFWAGFSLGRVAAVIATRTRSVDVILIGSCLAAAATAAVLALGDGNVAVAWAFTALLGFMLGPQYATMLVAADHRARLDGRSTSILVGVAGVGGLAGPLLTGLVLDAHGVDALPAVVGASVLISTIAAVVALAVPEHHDVAIAEHDHTSFTSEGKNGPMPAR